MFDNREKAAQEFIDGLAEMFESDQGNKVHRFTPSIKFGRRYLAIEGSDGYLYQIELNVSRNLLNGGQNEDV